MHLTSILPEVSCLHEVEVSCLHEVYNDTQCT